MTNLGAPRPVRCARAAACASVSGSASGPGATNGWGRHRRTTRRPTLMPTKMSRKPPTTMDTMTIMRIMTTSVVTGRTPPHDTRNPAPPVLLAVMYRDTRTQEAYTVNDTADEPEAMEEPRSVFTGVPAATVPSDTVSWSLAARSHAATVTATCGYDCASAGLAVTMSLGHMVHTHGAEAPEPGRYTCGTAAASPADPNCTVPAAAVSEVEAGQVSGQPARAVSGGVTLVLK